MPLAAGDMKFFESAEAGSLGGAVTAVPVPVGAGLFFDNIDYAEAGSGSAHQCKYRPQ